MSRSCGSESATEAVDAASRIRPRCRNQNSPSAKEENHEQLDLVPLVAFERGGVMDGGHVTARRPEILPCVGAQKCQSRRGPAGGGPVASYWDELDGAIMLPSVLRWACARPLSWYVSVVLLREAPCQRQRG